VYHNPEQERAGQQFILFFAMAQKTAIVAAAKELTKILEGARMTYRTNRETFAAKPAHSLCMEKTVVDVLFTQSALFPLLAAAVTIYKKLLVDTGATSRLALEKAGDASKLRTVEEEWDAFLDDVEVQERGVLVASKPAWAAMAEYPLHTLANETTSLKAMLADQHKALHVVLMRHLA